MPRISVFAPRVAAFSALMTASLADPAAADFVGVSRCNAAGGTNPPVLHFVDGGRRFIVRVGELGLTRDIVFNAHAATAWARSSGLFPEGTVFGNYAGYICGNQYEDAEEPAEQPAAPQQPEEPEEPEECEGPCQIG